jgi:hypothetical protein
VGSVLGGLVSAAVVLAGGAVAVRWWRGEPRLDPAIEARIAALRDEGRSLVAIRRALEGEGAPGGPWTTKAVKAALAHRPRRSTLANGPVGP